jgi:hypothetical protein
MTITQVTVLRRCDHVAGDRGKTVDCHDDRAAGSGKFGMETNHKRTYTVSTRDDGKLCGYS